MDKQLIERIALEEVMGSLLNEHLWLDDRDSTEKPAVVEFATHFLTRIDAERGKSSPRFQCYSTNDGDSWYEHPADAELLNDVGAHNVGDEFEVSAGWHCVTARYRVAKIPDQADDEFEVECISHPNENAPLFLSPTPTIPADFSLYLESAIISDQHAKWEDATILADDDPSYDTFCGGWKAAFKLLAAAQGERNAD